MLRRDADAGVGNLEANESVTIAPFSELDADYDRAPLGELALPSLGEAWHHNHDAFRRAAV